MLPFFVVNRESLAKSEALFRRVPDCELLFLAKVLGVEVMVLFPAKLALKELDPSLRLKVSTKHPRWKSGAETSGSLSQSLILAWPVLSGGDMQDQAGISQAR